MRTNAAFIISLLLVFLFAYTAVSKLIDSKVFASVLERVPLIGRGAGIVAILLPLAELLIVLLLLFEKTRSVGLYAALAMLCVFTVYLVYMILVVPQLPCSCGGVISKLSWKGHVAFNVAFVGLTVVGIRSMKKRHWPPSPAFPQRGKELMYSPDIDKGGKIGHCKNSLD